MKSFSICDNKDTGSKRIYPNLVSLAQQTNDGEFKRFGPIYLLDLNLSNCIAQLSFPVPLTVSEMSMVNISNGTHFAYSRILPAVTKHTREQSTEYRVQWELDLVCWWRERPRYETLSYEYGCDTRLIRDFHASPTATRSEFNYLYCFL